MKRLGLLFALFFLILTQPEAYLLSPEQILKNNIEHRKYLKQIKLFHRISFVEGFFSPLPFSCDETIYFNDHEHYRMDYSCDGIPITFLRNKKSFKIIRNQKVISLATYRPHFLVALFLFKQEDPFIQWASDSGFVSAEVDKSQGEAHNKKRAETSWKVEGTVTLVRLGPIEKGEPTKMEKNTALLLSPPSNTGKQIWFDKDLFLPVKIVDQGREFLFKNYRETSNSHKRFYRYPQKMDVQEGGVTGIVIETVYDRIDINPQTHGDLFDETSILKSQKTSFPEGSQIQEVVEKFIQEYR